MHSCASELHSVEVSQIAVVKPWFEHPPPSSAPGELFVHWPPFGEIFHTMHLCVAIIEHIT